MRIWAGLKQRAPEPCEPCAAPVSRPGACGQELGSGFLVSRCSHTSWPLGEYYSHGAHSRHRPLH